MPTANKRAHRIRAARLKQLKKRDRLSPCIEEYEKLLLELKANGSANPKVEIMSALTGILRGTYQTVLGQIAASGKEGIQVTNAIKRSAGTNYQGLCEYAIIRWIDSKNYSIAVGPNAPKSMKDELTIYGYDADGGEFSVEPDIDISLWVEADTETSPLIFISAKTSLVDRAGQAARWKMYLDMHQTACPHIPHIIDCPVNRTRIKIKTKHPITHAIATANIYKIDTTQPHGELLSGQCRNNTYMFKHKYTTRNDAEEARPNSWKGLDEFPLLVESVFADYLEEPTLF